MDRSFDLEKALSAWRRSLAYNRAFDDDDREELERHVRDQVAGLTARGMDEETAFHRALAEMGGYGMVEDEYRKVYWGKRRRRRDLLDEFHWRTAMLKNYLKVAWRNVLRHKGFALINVIGLAVGMACFILILTYVQYEFSYDRYHEKGHRIYRLVHAYAPDEDGEHQAPPAPEVFQVRGNAPVGPALNAEFPEVLDVVQFSGRRAHLLQNGERLFYQNNIFFMDSTVFDVFSWPLLAGDPRTALNRPFTAVLTESTARKYFGDENPVGQTLISNNKDAFTVTGIIADVPPNSHFSFDVLLSMVSMQQLYPGMLDSWGNDDRSTYFHTYFLVPEDHDIAALKAKLPAFVSRHVPQGGYTVDVEPLHDVYLHSTAVRRPGPIGNLSNLYVFSMVAVSILLIACINFMNLTTARSAERAKEVGVRKVVGARRLSLVGQFLSESMLLSVIAGVLSVGLAVLALPELRDLTGQVLSYAALFSPGALTILLGVTIVVGLLAGSYPALVLSRFRPAMVLKGAFRTSAQGIALRKVLVVFQFGSSVVLLVGTLVVFHQLDYLRSRALGFEQEHRFVIDFGYDTQVQQQIEAIKAAFMANPAVVSASASRTVPGTAFPSAYTEVEGPQGGMVEGSPGLYEIDFDYLPNFGIEMVAGRAFARDHPSDTTRALILNEAAVKHYGYQHPQDVIGKRFTQWDREGTVIGVTRDFNYQSLRSQVEPLALRLEHHQVNLSYLTLHLQTSDLIATVDAMEQLWSRLAPQRPFLYSFLDASLDQRYRAEERFGEIFKTFTGLAILIACLGLFGLVAFSVQYRTKEIGIRKVLGASAANLVVLLSREFALLVVIAFVVALPVAYFTMHGWLDGFAYRIDLGPGVFLLAGALVLAVTLLTVGVQAVKAALADPVKSLRYE